MKRAVYFFSLLLVFASCSSNSSKETSATKDSTNTSTPAKTEYTCPMHPNVVSDKPGQCPECGMDLAPKV